VSLAPVDDLGTLAGAGTAAPPARRRFALPGTGHLVGLVLPAALAAFWALASGLGLFPANLVPSPADVWREIRDLAASGELVEHLGVTGGRVAAGFLWGTLAATVLGTLTGYARPAQALLDPTLQALKAVPSLAWVPLFILWFGIFETSKVALIALGVFFPVYLSLSEAIRQTDRKLVEVGRIYRLSGWQLVRRILVPSTLPAYVVGLRGGLALGWMFVVAAELMGASSGLGYLMVDGQMTGRPAVIVAALILFALCGKLSDAVLAACARPFLAWQDGFAGMQRGGGNA